MKNKLLLLLLLISYFSFSQTEKFDYDIYSKIINEKSKNWFRTNKNIVVIEQYKNEDANDFYLLDELSKENGKTSELALNYLATKQNTIFKDKLAQEPNLRKVIRDFLKNLNHQPKIITSNLNIGSSTSTPITLKEFNSFFKKKGVENGWKEIKKSFNTTSIIEFSGVTYNQNFACLYFAIHCGGTCGNGSVIILEKINNEWLVLHEISLWES